MDLRHGLKQKLRFKHKFHKYNDLNIKHNLWWMVFDSDPNNLYILHMPI